MSKQIDFNDKKLVKFQSVESITELGGFRSDVKEFNDYIGADMAFDIAENISQVYLIIIAGYVAGYIAISMNRLRNNATPAIEGKEIEGNVPAILISHLAVDGVFQGHGVGKALLNLVITRLVPKLKKIIGCRYVMLNPIDDQGVRDFYINYGFEYVEKLNDGGEQDREFDACLFDLINIKKEKD